MHEQGHTATYGGGFSGTSPDEPNGGGSYRRWLTLLGAMVLAVGLAGVVLYRQRVERRAIIQEDLTAFIFEEETVRFQGQSDQAAAFIVPNAPRRWQEAYQETFVSTGAATPPALVTVDDVKFDGACALVTIHLDNHEQVRAYCLNGPGWARAPLSPATWGDEARVIELANGSQITYWFRDEAFAIALADEWPKLLEKVEALGGLQAAAPPSTALDSLEIFMEPHELSAPLVSADGPRIVLNSPLLVPFQAVTPFREGGRLAGRDAVRLALAEALLQRLYPSTGENVASLPGAARFTAAAYTVMAVHVALPQETQGRLVDSWRFQLDDRWESPFFAGITSQAEPLTLHRAELAARITAEHIYRLEEAETLLALLLEVSTTDSWDMLFQAHLNRSTLGLEREAAAWIGAEDANAIEPDKLNQAPASLSLPLQATLLSIQRAERADRSALIELAGQTEPIRLDIPSTLAFRTPGGPTLAPGCAISGSRLEVDGEWLEMGRRMRATRVTIREISAPPVELAPPDTVAYLLESNPSGEQRKLAVERIFPATRLYLTDSKMSLPDALVALRRDGAIKRLTALSPTLQTQPLPIAAGQSVHFLFTLALPGCDQDWFIHYQPAVGLTGQWLGPPQPARWVWRPDSQDLLYFKSSTRAGSAGYDLYLSADNFSVTPVGTSAIPLLFTGWHQDTGQLVFVRYWRGAIGVGLVEPVTGRIRRLKLYDHPFQARRLSPDGRWLAYLAGAESLFDPPYRLDLLNVEQLVNITLIRLEEEQGLGPPVWSSYMEQERLAVLSGPFTEQDILRPDRLLVASIKQLGAYETIAEAAAGEELAAPVFCADGGLLYRVDRSDRYRLVRHSPDQPAKTLLSQDHPFLPVACP